MNILGKYIDKKQKVRRTYFLAWDFHFFFNQNLKIAVKVKWYCVGCLKRLLWNRIDTNTALILLLHWLYFHASLVTICCTFKLMWLLFSTFFPTVLFLRRTNCDQERDRPSGGSLGHFTILIVLSLIYD